MMGFRTMPNGVVIRQLGVAGTGAIGSSFRRSHHHGGGSKRRDSWEEGATAGGHMHMQTHRHHGGHQPKFRETGRNKFGPPTSHGGFRH